MRTTLNIDEHILKKASELTGVKEKTSLVRMGLEALIARESVRRLAALSADRERLASNPKMKGGRASTGSIPRRSLGTRSEAQVNCGR